MGLQGQVAECRAFDFEPHLGEESLEGPVVLVGVFGNQCPFLFHGVVYYTIMEAHGVKLSFPIISERNISQTISSR